MKGRESYIQLHTPCYNWQNFSGYEVRLSNDYCKVYGINL